MVSLTLPFPSPSVSIPPKFSDKPVGGKVRSSEGEVPRLSPYKFHPAGELQAKTVATRCHILQLKCTEFDFGWGSSPDPAGEDFNAQLVQYVRRRLDKSKSCGRT